MFIPTDKSSNYVLWRGAINHGCISSSDWVDKVVSLLALSKLAIALIIFSALRIASVVPLLYEVTELLGVLSLTFNILPFWTLLYTVKPFSSSAFDQSPFLNWILYITSIFEYSDCFRVISLGRIGWPPIENLINTIRHINDFKVSGIVDIKTTLVVRCSCCGQVLVIIKLLDCSLALDTRRRWRQYCNTARRCNAVSKVKLFGCIFGWINLTALFIMKHYSQATIITMVKSRMALITFIAIARQGLTISLATASETEIIG